MKKNIGPALALYPTPAVVVGTMIENKPTWLLAGHVGIIGHDRIMVSLRKSQVFAWHSSEAGEMSRI